jgi:hypothetical protein
MQLQDDLSLQEPPRHIECFDNSNFQGFTALKTTTNITQATTTFMNVFEKPNSKYAFLDRRLNYANQALASMNGTAVPTRSTGMNINNG